MCRSVLAFITDQLNTCPRSATDPGFNLMRQPNRIKSELVLGILGGVQVVEHPAKPGQHQFLLDLGHVLPTDSHALDLGTVFFKCNVDSKLCWLF